MIEISTGETSMRGLGLMVLVGGLIGLLAAMGMDTSVSTDFGSVNNIGLMNDKQNYVVISCVALVAGVLMMIVPTSISPESTLATNKGGHTRNCPYCAEVIKSEAIKCRYRGEKVDLIEVDSAQRESGIEQRHDKYREQDQRLLLFVLLSFGGFLLALFAIVTVLDL
jgi:hypothetical protein